MKQITYLMICLWAGCALMSCNSNAPEKLDKEDFTLVKIPGKYSIQIPKYMKRSIGLNQYASLQYQNTTKGMYVIVIDEDTTAKKILSKAMELSGGSVLSYYRKQKMEQLGQDLKISKKHDGKLIKINGLEAETVNIDASTKEIETDVAYFFTFIEGKKSLYMLMGWTMASQRKKYQGTFGQVAKSFQEL
ncbi:hypothetical protein [Microscilla marina]|nr:hypothetical protein [Microscilla marina]